MTYSLEDFDTEYGIDHLLQERTFTHKFTYDWWGPVSAAGKGFASGAK